MELFLLTFRAMATFGILRCSTRHRMSIFSVSILLTNPSEDLVKTFICFTVAHTQYLLKLGLNLF